MKMQLKILLLLILLIPCWLISLRYNVDLKVLHHTAKLVLNQDYAHIYVASGGPGRFFYGPITLLGIGPLGTLTFDQAMWLWNVVQTIGFAIFCVCLWRLYPWLGRTEQPLSWLVVFIVAVNPIHNNFQSGNIQILLAAALCTAELGSRSKKPSAQFMGGFLCLLCAAIKVYPALLVAYTFLTKRNPVRWGILAALAISVLLPFIGFGLQPGKILFSGFIHNLFTYSADNPYTIMDILCLPSALARLVPDFTVKETIIRTLTGLVAVWFLAWSTWKNRSSTARSVDLWALAMALMAFLNPSSRPHYFIFFVPAFCSLLEVAPLERRNPYRLATLASAILIALTVEGVVGRDFNNWLEWHSIPTLGILVLIVTLFSSVTKTKVV